MLAAMIVLTASLALVVGPLVWRLWRDRLEARALAVRADIQHVVDRHLGGESFISVAVTPPTAWRPGRVVLSVPADWEPLVEPLWGVVLRRLPTGYELVVPGRPAHTEPAPAVLKPAA